MLHSEADVIAVARALFTADANLATLTAKANDGATKTTCVIMTLMDGEQYILTSNCGDSGAYFAYLDPLSTNDILVEPLAILHNPTEPDEKERLRQTKGAVVIGEHLNGKI